MSEPPPPLVIVENVHFFNYSLATENSVGVTQTLQNRWVFSGHSQVLNEDDFYLLTPILKVYWQ